MRSGRSRNFFDMEKGPRKEHAAVGGGIDDICRTITSALNVLGVFQRRFYPPALAGLRQMVAPLKTDLGRFREQIGSLKADEDVRDAVDASADAAGLILQAVDAIVDAPERDSRQAVIQVMRSFRKISQAQERLYPVRWMSPVLNRFFLEEGVSYQPDKFDFLPDAEFLVGLNHYGTEDHGYARSGVSIYVPEYYTDTVSWPVVVALHGGHGHGRDFIWTWLREARSRGFILVAPTSKGDTWSILEPGVDGGAIVRMIQFLQKHYRFDTARILLTGISDGGTFALQMSPINDMPFSAYAVIAGVLAPMNINGAKNKRIYWAHGALDWMFPVDMAREACRTLEAVGADVTLRVLDDLSHTYPREENDRILRWFDTGLALSGAPLGPAGQ